MPTLKLKKSIKLPRRLSAFLDFRGGVVRGSEPQASPESDGSGIQSGQIVWIFGTGRTGSTWIAAMLEDMSRQRVWFEPRVGICFKEDEMNRHDGGGFYFASRYRNVWLESVKNMVLDGANARFPDLGDGDLFIKEPGGSQGAPTLVEATPDSRVVLLVRDPRDVVASWLDAGKKTGWQSKRLGREETAADTNPNAFVRRHAQSYLKNVAGAKKAYDAHSGRKVLVRYEDLRADAAAEMGRMYTELGIGVDFGELSRVAAKHSWERIPEVEKGEGKFYRKGVAGGWREDLSVEQARIVEKATSPLIEELGYL